MRLGFPRWIGKKWRWGLGLEFSCPHCNDRLSIFFVNPCDGLRPDAPIGAQLYLRLGTGLGAVTVSPDIEIAGHGQFEIFEGEILFRLH